MDVICAVVMLSYAREEEEREREERGKRAGGESCEEQRGMKCGACKAGMQGI